LSSVERANDTDVKGCELLLYCQPCQLDTHKLAEKWYMTVDKKGYVDTSKVKIE